MQNWQFFRNVLCPTLVSYYDSIMDKNIVKVLHFIDIHSDKSELYITRKLSIRQQPETGWSRTQILSFNNLLVFLKKLLDKQESQFQFSATCVVATLTRTTLYATTSI